MLLLNNPPPLQVQFWNFAGPGGFLQRGRYGSEDWAQIPLCRKHPASVSACEYSTAKLHDSILAVYLVRHYDRQLAGFGPGANYYIFQIHKLLMKYYTVRYVMCMYACISSCMFITYV